MTNRNESELLFEEYLIAHGYTDWTHEVPIEGKRKNPDHRLEYGGSSVFFEVKEFDAPMPKDGSYDPYGPIRKKIDKAADKFKEYRGFSCSLVLANPKQAFVHLGDPWAIIGSMWGNLGFTFQLGVMPDKDRPVEQVFLGGGMVIPQKNTTLSSIIVLGTYPLRERQIRIAIKNRENELGRNTSFDEEWELGEKIPDSAELRRVRVIVYENQFARIPFSRDLFRGPFDERWGVDGEFLRRVYVGGEVAAIESVLNPS